MNHHFDVWDLEENAVMGTIYALFFPETAQVLTDLWAEKPIGLYPRAYANRPDDMHTKFLNLWRRWSGIDLRNDFPWDYYCNGASEPIAHILLPRKGFFPKCRLHVFEGEYQGYEAIAKAAGMKMIAHHERDELDIICNGKFKRGDIFFISNPSGIDGEYWGNLDVFIAAMQVHHPEVEVVLDVTYQGLTKTTVNFPSYQHSNISAVIFSLSKPFGVYPHRIGGVFSRKEIPSLFGNKWFKNYFSIELGTRLMQKFPRSFLPRMYAHVQKEAIAFAKKTGQIPESAKASNVLLLATSKEGPKEYKRADNLYRYCLTPYIDQVINWNARP